MPRNFYIYIAPKLARIGIRWFDTVPLSSEDMVIYDEKGGAVLIGPRHDCFSRLTLWG